MGGRTRLGRAFGRTVAWRDRAACLNYHPDMWDVEDRRLTVTNIVALTICHTCPVMRECRRYYRPSPLHMCIAGGKVWTIKGSRLLTKTELKRFGIQPYKEDS